MPSRDYFSLFGLDRKLGIDLADLQRRFYGLSRRWHPDRFSRKPEAEQREALDMTSAINDAYRALKDPIRRAEYVLAAAGFPIGEQRSKDVPPELLEEVFELNMMLEEIKTGDDSSRPELERAAGHFAELRAAADRELLACFAAHDASVDAGSEAPEALQAIRGVLNRRRYIENLIRDVDRARQPAAAEAAPLR